MKACVGQDRCTIPIDYRDFNLECLKVIEARASKSINDDLIKSMQQIKGNDGKPVYNTVYAKDSTMAEPVLLTVTYCDSEEIIINH